MYLSPPPGGAGNCLGSEKITKNTNTNFMILSLDTNQLDIDNSWHKRQMFNICLAFENYTQLSQISNMYLI